MEYRKLTNWKLDQISEGLVFFVQRIDELLFHFTIDSYKPKALNAPFLCIEALEIIDEVISGNIDKHNIDYIISELKYALNIDFIAKKLIPQPPEYFLNYTEGDYENLRTRIGVLERCLERYRYYEEIKKTLKSCIIANEKDKINYIAQSLLTTLLNWEISSQYLYLMFNDFFFDQKKIIDSNEVVDEFLDTLFPLIHHFTIYFKITNNIVNLSESFRFFGIEIFDGKDKQTIEETKKIRFKDDCKIICIKNVKSGDPFMARDIAENRLNTLKNTAQLYFHKNRITWSKNAMVIQQCCSHIKRYTKRNINPMIVAQNYKVNEVAEKTNSIFKYISLRGDSFEKFNRAIELHSNSIHYLKPENQLANLWTIFETIIPGSKSKSKVQNIVDSVVPVISRNYLPKLINTLFNDINRWNRKYVDGIIGNITEDGSIMKKFVCFLSLEKYSEERKALYEEIGDYQLLRNRIYKMSELIMNKEKIVEKINIHSKFLLWQIRRIYRTRNFIVHSGKSVSYLSTLIENAHEYIDQLIEEVIQLSTKQYRVLNLIQSIELSKILYEDMVKKIESSEDVEGYLDYII